MTTRRRFLTNSAAAIASSVLSGHRLQAAAETVGRTIRLGHIGVGGQGTSLLRNFLSVRGAASVAIADPYRSRREAAGRAILESQGREARLHADFRDLLADPEVDAVVIATPDHWHVPIGLAAVRAGKDVYLEKPLGHSLAQNKAMLDACRKHDRVFQYGTQQRSQEILRRGIELVLNGAIGPVERIEIWAPKGTGGGSLEEIPVPEGLDYDLYLGPAPMRPCTRDRLTSAASWHCADYSFGFIAGWGAHPLDISIWGQDHDLKGPFTVKGSGTVATPDGLFNTITSWDVHMAFAGGVEARFMSDDIARPEVGSYRKNWSPDGTTFFGPDGWVSLSRNGYAASNPDGFRRIHGPDARRVPYQNHFYRAFIDAVRDRSASIAPIQDAVRSDALSHLSALAIRTGQEIRWDPQTYRILSPESAIQRMDHPARGDWMKTDS